MFTGIIQKVATVKTFTKTGENAYELVITNPYAKNPGAEDGGHVAPVTFSEPSAADAIELGESVANNGVCLTVTEFSADHLKFDLSPETIERSSLSRLKVGSKVNLERSLRMGDRLSGHWVQGHVDGTAKVTEISEVTPGYFDLAIEPTDPKLLKYCVKKGSLSVDGISLTIHSLNEKQLKFQIIPHTWAMTCLSDLSIGDLVNIEVDILAKYIERFHEFK